MNWAKAKKIFSSDVFPPSIERSSPIIFHTFVNIIVIESTFIIGAPIGLCICHHSGQIIAFFATINFKSPTFMISLFWLTVILNPESPNRPEVFSVALRAALQPKIVGAKFVRSLSEKKVRLSNIFLGKLHVEPYLHSVRFFRL